MVPIYKNYFIVSTPLIDAIDTKVFIPLGFLPLISLFTTILQ